MKHILFTFSVLVLSRHLFARGSPTQGAADQPYTMEYYYKVQWGHQQEFLQLFLKESLPAPSEDCADGPHDLGQDRATCQSYDRGRALGTTA
jgi:hypothetical protein